MNEVFSEIDTFDMHLNDSKLDMYHVVLYLGQRWICIT